MKGVSNIAKKSQNILCEDWSTWIPVYYSYKTNTVYTTEGPDRYFVTKIINPTTAEGIKKAVERWMMM